MTSAQPRRPRATSDAQTLPEPVRRFQRQWHHELFAQAVEQSRQRNFRKALELAQEAVRIDPDVARSWVGYGAMLRQAGRLKASAASLRRAIRLTPRNARAWSQLGETLLADKRPQAALASHARAIGFESDTAILHLRHARTLVALGRDETALQAIARALEIDPASAEAAWLRGECLRRLGRWAEGWPDYELRFRPELGGRPLGLESPRWRGEALGEGALMVVCEQAYGDAIWAARALASARERCGRLVVRCRRELGELFAALPAVDAVLIEGDPAPAHNAHVPICDLPLLLPASGEASPYMASDPALAPRFARWLGLAEHRLKVGLVWAGAAHGVGDAARSLPLAPMLETFSLPGVQLFALQKSAPSAALSELTEAIEPAEIIDLGPQLRDFRDTAALLAGLDLLITVDTAAAHLAGALGRPAWLLLNTPPHWLWGAEGQATSWYPSLRLFRTARPGDWAGALDAAAGELLALAGHRLQPSRVGPA